MARTCLQMNRNLILTVVAQWGSSFAYAEVMISGKRCETKTLLMFVHTHTGYIEMLHGIAVAASRVNEPLYYTSL